MQSESVKILSEVAKMDGVWLLGGCPHVALFPRFVYLPPTGSIPEKDPSDSKIYNSSTAYSSQGTSGSLSSQIGSNIRPSLRGTRSHYR
ncbi:hypothetical protein H4582DRAFT_472929 [Lactarius indigo]|nr:hypothetical protein H4582DRAFT_472929 [Lactarius indigo]